MTIRSHGALRRNSRTHGAELAFTYQGEAFGRRVAPLAAKVGAKLVLPCDVEDSATVAAVFETLGKEWGGLDFVVHAIGFLRQERTEGTLRRHDRARISCAQWSFPASRSPKSRASGRADERRRLAADADLCRLGPRHAQLQCHGASPRRPWRQAYAIWPTDFGPRGIRVNALSPGPVRTLAGAGISDARYMFSFQQRNSPLRRPVTLDEIGGSALYLLLGPWLAASPAK